MHCQYHLTCLTVILIGLLSMAGCDDGKVEPASGGTLVSISDCFYLYFRSGTIDERQGETVPLGQVSSATGNCVTGSPTTQASNVQIEFSFPANENYSKMVLYLALDQPEPASGYWKASKATADLTSVAGVETLTFDVNEINSLDRFSFSCSELVLINTKASGPASITLHNFQVQGFAGQVFEESFDCSPWFTLGMWMSLGVILMFVTIITIGICFIVSVQTNDQFEDPRGKPLYIPTSD